MKKNILTTHYRKDRLWSSKVDILNGYEKFHSRHGWTPWWQSLVTDLYWGGRLFVVSKKYYVVVTGSERLAFIFAFLQKFRTNKVRHIILQSMWNIPTTPIVAKLKKFFLVSILKSVDSVIVYDSRQKDIYSNYLDIDKFIFRFLHSYTSLLNDEDVCVKDGDYIFSGGDTNRDYDSLIKAVEPLAYRVVIVTSRADELRARPDVPSHIDITSRVPPNEFNQLIAGSALVVVPLIGGRIEAGGRTVYQNAMALGKPVIVADDSGAVDYIRNGVDGIVVRSGDVEGLRAAISRLMDDRSFARKIGGEAKRAGKQFSSENFYTKLLSIIDGTAIDLERT